MKPLVDLPSPGIFSTAVSTCKRSTRRFTAAAGDSLLPCGRHLRALMTFAPRSWVAVVTSSRRGSVAGRLSSELRSRPGPP
jgi:hypothetical protein